jgi:hypothetical protein
MVQRLMFLGIALLLLGLGIHAAANPNGARKENADGPDFRTGLAKMPLWFFRLMGLITVGMAGFFAYMFWIH